MSCGDNAKGCLGQRGVSSQQHPKQIESFDGIAVKQINCGPNHVVALDANNQLYTWGYCKWGALGLGTKMPFSFIPQQVPAIGGQQQLKHISKIICGPECTIILLESGELWAAGRNTDNRLGFGLATKQSMVFVRTLPIFHLALTICTNNIYC